MSTEITEKSTQLTHSERFTQKVLAEFNGNVAGGLDVSTYQRKLIRHYFVAIDNVLETAELKRNEKKEKLPIVWNNVNMNALAIDAVNLARLGLDPAVKNHISFIPYKNNRTQKYDIGFITGYVGLEHVAKKYALEEPVDVIVELVYKSDTFKPIKKSPTNKYESYEFDITNPFDRGEIVGGFYYYVYANPEKNRLVVMSLKDIMKRKPKYASAEFWGGEKDTWDNGQKVGKEKVEGWFDEMCLKTIKRAAYGGIPIDPEKVDDNYNYLKKREAEIKEEEVEAEIAENANKDVIDVTYENVTEEKEALLSGKPQDDIKSSDGTSEEGPGF